MKSALQHCTVKCPWHSRRCRVHLFRFAGRILQRGHCNEPVGEGFISLSDRSGCVSVCGGASGPVDVVFHKRAELSAASIFKGGSRTAPGLCAALQPADLTRRHVGDGRRLAHDILSGHGTDAQIGPRTEGLSRLPSARCACLRAADCRNRDGDETNSACIRPPLPAWIFGFQRGSGGQHTYLPGERRPHRLIVDGRCRHLQLRFRRYARPLPTPYGRYKTRLLALSEPF